MKKQLVALGVVWMLISVAYADADIVAGHYGPAPSAAAPTRPFGAEDLAKLLGRDAVHGYYDMMDRNVGGILVQEGGVVTFDDRVEPCSFIETSALRGVRQGAAFTAPGNNGGGVLDQCSNFAIDAFSLPNFLAFNAGSPFNDGGVSRLPQLVFFPGGANTVTLQVSEGGFAEANAQIILAGIGDGAVQDLQQVVLNADWQAVTLSGPIDILVVAGSVSILLIDDIAAQ
ncbi:MAG: hypothetical protein AAGA68_07220 [Pseudomonadota bacterium]